MGLGLVIGIGTGLFALAKMMGKKAPPPAYRETPPIGGGIVGVQPGSGNGSLPAPPTGGGSWTGGGGYGPCTRTDPRGCPEDPNTKYTNTMGMEQYDRPPSYYTPPAPPPATQTAPPQIVSPITNMLPYLKQPVAQLPSKIGAIANLTKYPINVPVAPQQPPPTQVAQGMVKIPVQSVLTPMMAQLAPPSISSPGVKANNFTPNSTLNRVTEQATTTSSVTLKPTVVSPVDTRAAQSLPSKALPTGIVPQNIGVRQPTVQPQAALNTANTAKALDLRQSGSGVVSQPMLRPVMPGPQGVQAHVGQVGASMLAISGKATGTASSLASGTRVSSASTGVVQQMVGAVKAGQASVSSAGVRLK